MKSLWLDSQAAEYTEKYCSQGLEPDLAARVYTTQLLGRDPRLVLHGGGNTSVKIERKDLYGNPQPVLCVKGSGWNMDTIEPPGLPALYLGPLLGLRELDSLSDEQMVAEQRRALIDPGSPNPSVETLLHAFIPKKFIDHTHSSAVLSITNQPGASELCRQVFGDRVSIVDYIMPGFDLAKAAALAFEQQPDQEGMILLKHGIFTFGDTAKQAYERMIELVSCAEDYITEAKNAKGLAKPSATITPVEEAQQSLTLARLRGLLNLNGRPMVLNSRSNPKTLAWASHPRIASLSQAGVATPDHVLRTKFWPLLLSDPRETSSFAEDAQQRIEGFCEKYSAWFAENNQREGSRKTQLDPLPRLLIVPGIGLVGCGKDLKAARIAADIGELTIETILDAEAIGSFESIDHQQAFDMEYWSLEQAKLGKQKPAAMQGKVVLITGGAGTIGLATAQAFKAQGAEVVISDVSAEKAADCAQRYGFVAGYGCDITRPAEVSRLIQQICSETGGLDIVVNNAGIAISSSIGELDMSELRRSFEVNFFGHQEVCRAALEVFKAQGKECGGYLLFNISKQAVNPGKNFGAYGLAKQALLGLMRQYAIDHAEDGVIAGGVNADRIRSGLLTDQMVTQRAEARGVSQQEYLAGNLVGKEVDPEDVAQAFVQLASSPKTTGGIITVDGGNVAAMLR